MSKAVSKVLELQGLSSELSLGVSAASGRQGSVFGGSHSPGVGR